MKRIIYAGSEILTGDDIAVALLRYSEALAEVGQAETVTIPAMEPDGSIERVDMLVGPASQIVAVPARRDDTELIDEGVVEDLEARTRRLRPVAIIDQEPPGDEADFDRGL